MRTSSLGTLALVQAPGTSAHSSPRRLHAHSPNTTHTYTSDLLLSVFERGPFEPRTAHLLYDSLNPKRPRPPKTPSPPPRSKIYTQKTQPTVSAIWRFFATAHMSGGTETDRLFPGVGVVDGDPI